MNLVAKGFLYFKMEIDMKDSYSKVKKMVKVNIIMSMVIYMMVIGKMIKNVDKENTVILELQKNMMENG